MSKIILEREFSKIILKKKLINGEKVNKKQFGYKVLGPIFYNFCEILREYQLCYSDAKALYASRAGVRIKDLFILYLKNNGYSESCDQQDFWVSRFSVYKAFLDRDFEYVLPFMINAFLHMTYKNMLKCIIPNSKCDSKYANETITLDIFRKIYYEDQSNCSKALRKHFNEQEILFNEYLDQNFSNTKNLLIIDSGWHATGQAMFMRNLKQFNWVSLYFGRWNPTGKNAWHFYNVTGCIIEHNFYNPFKPETAILRYFHLIEDILEPSMPSVEYYLKENGKVISNADRSKIKAEKDPLFEGIIEYFNDSKPRISPYVISLNSKKAIKRLKKMICFPNKKIAELLVTPPRSNDFGKTTATPVLNFNRSRKLKEKIKSIKRSLWKEGQIAIEFSWLHKLINIIIEIKYYIKHIKRKLIV